MKRAGILFFLFFIPLLMFGENDSQLSLNVSPHIQVPFAADPIYFTTGGGVDIAGEFQLPFLSLLGVHAELGYAYLPIWTGDGINLFSFGGGIGFYFPKIRKLSTQLFGSGGYYYGIIADSEGAAGGNLFFSGGGRIGFGISPAYDIGITIKYRYLANGGGALFSGLSFGISNRYSFLRTQQLKIEDLQLHNVFPVLYKYYENNSIGSVTIRNAGAATVEDIEVSFFVDKYMDNPTSSTSPGVLVGGETVEIDVFALFAEKVLDITEATVVSGNVEISYTQNNKRYTVEKSGPLRLFDRHAMTWDDDRKVAAYVTYKDPVIIDIAKSLVRETKETGIVVDNHLSTAMALHESLRLYGMSYVVDPTTPFIEFSKQTMAVDYIQFPRNTLYYKSGDCDDLSILYTSLLQAVGIDTAFITIPGHIYMAFALALAPEEAVKTLSDPGDIIIYENKAWVPIEITRVNSSFLEAWKTGVLQWKENDPAGAAQMYPMRSSWEIYEPIGYIGESANFTFIPDGEIGTVYQKEKERFAEREIFAQTRDLQARLHANNRNVKALNKIGAVYARYDRVEEAKAYFDRVLQIKEYYPALVNTGNILYLEDNLRDALPYYLRAEKLKPDSSILLLQLSRIHNKLGNLNESAAYFDKLEAVNPKMADRYSYLDVSKSSTAKASGQEAGKEMMLWQEEE